MPVISVRLVQPDAKKVKFVTFEVFQLLTSKAVKLLQFRAKKLKSFAFEVFQLLASKVTKLLQPKAKALKFITFSVFQLLTSKVTKLVQLYTKEDKVVTLDKSGATKLVILVRFEQPKKVVSKELQLISPQFLTSINLSLSPVLLNSIRLNPLTSLANTLSS